jgi:hypothetical protein
MNGYNVERRLERLQLLLQPAGCPNCRGWIGTVVCDPTYEHCTRPQACSVCGREVSVEQTIVIEGIDWSDV